MMASFDPGELRRLPKVHLHVHLENAVRASTLAELAASHGVTVSAGWGAGTFATFDAFLEYNTLVRNCLRSPSDFYRIAVEYCEDEARDGVRYAETYFTAAAHGERLGDLDMPLAAVLDGLAEGCSRFGVSVKLLLDQSRRRSVDLAWRTLDLARRFAGRGVIGVGMASDERFSLVPFVEVFWAARDAGLRVVHHAGESLGAASVREALELGLAERIAHGVGALEDAALVDELIERGVALDVCPSANVAVGLHASLAEHPIGALMRTRLLLSINTDIPAAIGITLTEEYRRIGTMHGLDRDGFAALARRSVAASFASNDLRRRLGDEIGAWVLGTRGSEDR